MAEVDGFTIGQRCTVKGNAGTIRYIGETQFAQGEWIGVELDDPVGKNDGSVQDVRYFECTPKHGSFIRQTQVQPFTTTAKVQDTPAPASAPTPTPAQSHGTPTQPRATGGSGIPTRTRTPLSPSTTRSPTSRLPRPGAASSIPSPKTTLPQESRLSKTTASSIGRASTSSTSPGRAGAGVGGSTNTPIRGTSSLQSPADARVRTTTAASTGSRLASSPRGTGVTPHAQKKRLEEPTPKAVVDDGEILRLNEIIEQLEQQKADLEQQKAQDYKDHERTRLALEQMNEYKQTWAANQKEVTAKLREAEHAAKQAEERVAAMEVEVAEANEQLEDSLLDKEMAEENLEISQSEATSVREELEALKLDYEIMQMEANTPASAGDGEGGASALQVKMYTAEIDKYKAAIVQLKDMSDNEKTQLTNQIVALEKKVTPLGVYESKCGELQQTILAQEATIDELKLTVDECSGAVEMVETLTEQQLDLEEQIREFKDQIAEFETLIAVNDEMEAQQQELQKSLSTELDFAQAEAAERARELTMASHRVAEYSRMVDRLKDIIADQQAQLQAAGEDGRITVAQTPEDIATMQAIAMNQMQLRQEEQRSVAAQIDTELLKMDLSLAVRKSDLLLCFVPQAWTKGRNVTVMQGIEVLLLLDRLLTKSRVLVHTLATHNALDSYLQPHTSATVAPHSAEMAPEMVYTLACALLRIQQYATALDVFRDYVEGATGPDLVAVTNRIAEISVCESIVDDLIGLCSRNELAADEPSPQLVVKGIEVLQALTRHAFSTNPGSVSHRKDVADTNTAATPADGETTSVIRTHTHTSSKGASAVRRSLETVRAQCYAFGAALAVLRELTVEPTDGTTEGSQTHTTEDAAVQELVGLSDGDGEEGDGQLKREGMQQSMFDSLMSTNYAVYTCVQAQLGSLSEKSRAQNGSGQVSRNISPMPMHVDGESDGREAQRSGDAHSEGCPEEFESLDYYLSTHSQLVDTLVSVARQVGAGNALLTRTDLREIVHNEVRRREGFCAIVEQSAQTNTHTHTDDDTHMHTTDSTNTPTDTDTAQAMDIDIEHAEEAEKTTGDNVAMDDVIAELAHVHATCEAGLKHFLQTDSEDQHSTQPRTHTRTLDTPHAHVPPSLVANAQVLQKEYVELEGMRQSVASYATDVEQLQVALGEAQADLETEQTRNDMYAQKLKEEQQRVLGSAHNSAEYAVLQESVAVLQEELKKVEKHNRELKRENRAMEKSRNSATNSPAIRNLEPRSSAKSSPVKPQAVVPEPIHRSSVAPVLDEGVVESLVDAINTLRQDNSELRAQIAEKTLNSLPPLKLNTHTYTHTIDTVATPAAGLPVCRYTEFRKVRTECIATLKKVQTLSASAKVVDISQRTSRTTDTQESVHHQSARHALVEDRLRMFDLTKDWNRVTDNAISRIAHLAAPTSKLAFKEFPTPALLKALTPAKVDHTGVASSQLLGRVKTAAVTAVSTALTVDHTQLKALHAVFVA